MIRKLVATLLLIALPALPALAGNGNGKGKGNGNGNGGQGNSHKGNGNAKHGGGGGNGESWSNEHDDHDHSPRFSDNDRDYWRDYWNDQYEHGNCPPGLAKKHNGCMPPGHAKKIRIGQRLPRHVIYHEVPAAVAKDAAPACRFGP